MNNLPDALEFRVAGSNLTPAASPLFAGLSVLVVEDHALIALDLETMLLDLGVGQVTIAPSTGQALELISTKVFDAALMDIRLGKTTSLPVAMALREIGVPFAFATGYGSVSTIPEDFRAQPLLPKPFLQHEVGNILRILLGFAGDR